MFARFFTLNATSVRFISFDVYLFSCVHCKVNEIYLKVNYSCCVFIVI